MPGDPARIDRIIPFLDDVQKLAYNREFRSVSGYYKGVKVIAISTGIGGSSASIAIEELKHIGVDTMIRIGSCGALQKEMRLPPKPMQVGVLRPLRIQTSYKNASKLQKKTTGHTTQVLCTAMKASISIPTQKKKRNGPAWVH